MKTIGKHLLADLFSCNCNFLDNKEKIEETMIKAAKLAGASIIGCLFHQFSPQGVSGVVVISESHLSIHTWPEEKYAAIDVYTCGDCVPERAIGYLIEAFNSTAPKVDKVIRGEQFNPQTS